LSKRGHRVLLVEQHPDFLHNNFSSGGSVLSIMAEFDLPQTLVRSKWRALDVLTTAHHYHWQNTEVQGVILDFAALRGFLVRETLAHGGSVWLNHKYLRHEERGGRVTVTFLNRSTRTEITLETRFLIDATGSQHSVINRDSSTKQPYVETVGLEYLIKADPSCHPQDLLTFLVGDTWMPKGYAWIFPMDTGVYRVGAMIFMLDSLKNPTSISPYIEQVILGHLKLKDYILLEKHGGMVRYCTPEAEHGYRGQVIAVGDAFSCINILGAEGIRHGMRSANLLADHLDNLPGYRKVVLSLFNRDWKRCEAYAKQGYRIGAERRLDFVFHFLQKFPLSVVVDVLFHYRFGRLKWLVFKRIVCKLFRI
jgi:flavin-dependent dehydrogenase